MGGAFMENFIVSEIRKSFLNAVFDAPLYFYRNRGGKEVDLVLECDGGLYPIEIKKTASSNVGMTRPFATLDKSSIPRPPGGGAIICMAEAFWCSRRQHARRAGLYDLAARSGKGLTFRIPVQNGVCWCRGVSASIKRDTCASTCRRSGSVCKRSWKDSARIASARGSKGCAMLQKAA